MNLFVSPHNDDEALFGVYTCLRYRPRVLVLLRSFVEAGWPNGPDYMTREKETAASCKILGCEYEQWEYPDTDPDWYTIGAHLRHRQPARVWAPLPESGGHPHHNVIGDLCKAIWPQTEFYATYTHANGKTYTGTLVEPEEGWEDLKRQAMACYVSQATHPNTQIAFNGWPIDEYLS